MKTKLVKRAASALFMALMLGFVAGDISAQKTSENREEIKEAREEAREAAKVLTTMMKKPDDFIPRELLEKAEAIAIFPDVVKAGFIIGGRGGDGVVARRTANGWSVPVFYNIGGASVGAQIGVKKTDFVMLFMNDGSLRDLLDGNLEFGGALSFAAGPVGRTIGAGTDPSLNVGVLTWSMSEGAFIGATLKGAVLTADNSMNKAVYGMEAQQILADPAKAKTAGLPAEMMNFSRTVASYAGSKARAAMTDNVSDESSFVNANFAGAQDRNKNFAQMRSPQRLAREVRNELLTLPYYSVFDWIEFEVDPKGVVTLRGQVTTPPDTKSAAEAYVEDVEGVTRVVNSIEVLPLSPNDERLRQALYREIYSGALFRYQIGSLQSIHIIVRNGRATLKGVVDTEGDRNIAGIRAKTVSGVFEVDNELVVRSDKRAN